MQEKRSKWPRQYNSETAAEHERQIQNYRDVLNRYQLLPAGADLPLAADEVNELLGTVLASASEMAAVQRDVNRLSELLRMSEQGQARQDDRRLMNHTYCTMVFLPE